MLKVPAVYCVWFDGLSYIIISLFNYVLRVFLSHCCLKKKQLLYGSTGLRIRPLLIIMPLKKLYQKAPFFLINTGYWEASARSSVQSIYSLLLYVLDNVVTHKTFFPPDWEVLRRSNRRVLIFL